jgi:rhodanese-related sulfurtransferase
MFMLRKLTAPIVMLALVHTLTCAVASATENPAAWEAAAAYLSSLPEGFNGIRGEVLKAKLDSGEQVFLLDVRQPNEFANGHIEGAVNVPVREVPKSLTKLPEDKNAPIVVVCASAVRSGYVTQTLAFKGYTNVKHLAAGYIAGWEKAGYPVKR